MDREKEKTLDQVAIPDYQNPLQDIWKEMVEVTDPDSLSDPRTIAGTCLFAGRAQKGTLFQDDPWLLQLDTM